MGTITFDHREGFVISDGIIKVTFSIILGVGHICDHPRVFLPVSNLPLLKALVKFVPMPSRDILGYLVSLASSEACVHLFLPLRKTMKQLFELGTLGCDSVQLGLGGLFLGRLVTHSCSEVRHFRSQVALNI